MIENKPNVNNMGDKAVLRTFDTPTFIYNSSLHADCERQCNVTATTYPDESLKLVESL